MIQRFIKWLRGCDHAWSEWRQSGYDDISRTCAKCSDRESEFSSAAEAYPPESLS